MSDQLIEYKTVREDFSIYKCENGQILRHKSTIPVMYGAGSNPTRIATRHIFYIETSDSVDSSYLEKLAISDTSPHKTYDLKYEPTQISINIYETESHVLFLYPIVDRITLTDQRSKNGDPILNYTSRDAISIISKEAFRHGTLQSKTA